MKIYFMNIQNGQKCFGKPRCSILSQGWVISHDCLDRSTLHQYSSFISWNLLDVSLTAVCWVIYERLCTWLPFCWKRNPRAIFNVLSFTQNKQINNSSEDSWRPLAVLSLQYCPVCTFNKSLCVSFIWILKYFFLSQLNDNKVHHSQVDFL